MTDELLNAMTVHRQSAKFDWVFTNQENGEPYKVGQKHMRQFCKRSDVKAFGYHAIRHLTASILVQADVPMATIQRILKQESYYYGAIH